MIEVKQYKCEHCGTLYKDQHDCEDCEKQHRFPVEIVSAKHLAKNVCARYPTSINVKFDNGLVVQYNKS